MATERVIPTRYDELFAYYRIGMLTKAERAEFNALRAAMATESR